MERDLRDRRKVTRNSTVFRDRRRLYLEVRDRYLPDERSGMIQRLGEAVLRYS